MNQQQQFPWRPTIRQLQLASGIAALAFLIIVICGYLFGWKWTGFPKQKLWDWLDLLIVPAPDAHAAAREAIERVGEDHINALRGHETHEIQAICTVDHSAGLAIGFEVP